MRKPMTTTLLALTLGVASLTLAACGQDDGASQTTPPEPTATETAPMSDSANTLPESGTHMEQGDAAGNMSSDNMGGSMGGAMDSADDAMNSAADQVKDSAEQMGNAMEGAADSAEQAITGDNKTAE